MKNQLQRYVYIVKYYQTLNIVCNDYVWYKMVRIII